MRKTLKRIACALLAAMLLGTCAFGAFAVNEYMKHDRWHAITASEAVKKLNDGDTFVMMCYRTGCGNCKYIGANVVMEWMDTYDKDVYGVDVDASEGVPSFIWDAMGKTSATLPFLAFVQNGKAQAFSPEGDLEAFAEKLNDTFFSFFDDVARKSLTVVTMPEKTVYNTGETLDTTGLTLELVRKDATTETLTDGYTCTGFSSDQPGHKTITVSYEDVQTTFVVAVNTPDGKPAVWVEQPAKSKLPYKNSTRLTADYCNLPEDAHMEWSYQYTTIRGKQSVTQNGASVVLTAEGFSQNVTVTVTAVGADGKTIVNGNGDPVTATHTIRFQNNIFYRLKALIDKLLGRGGCESEV